MSERGVLARARRRGRAAVLSLELENLTAEQRERAAQSFAGFALALSSRLRDDPSGRSARTITAQRGDVLVTVQAPAELAPSLPALERALTLFAEGLAGAPALRRT